MAKPSNSDNIPPEFERLIFRHRDLLDASLFSEAEEALEQLMEYVLEQAHDHFEYNPDFQEQLLAHEYEKRGEWFPAQAIYERRLAYCGQNDFFERASRCRDLATFHANLGELNLASLYRAQATYYFRQSTHADTGNWYWLMQDAILAQKHGRYSDAIDAADEALLDLTKERSGDQTRSVLLITRARCHLALGNLESAEADQAAAWECLAPWDVFEAAVGVLNTFAGWWRLSACLWEQQDDVEHARHCWEQSLEYIRKAVESWDEGDHHMLLPLSLALVEYGQFLLRHSEQAEAAEQFAESDQIRARFNLAPLDHPPTL